MPNPAAQWPELPFPAWSETCDTLQLWTQIVGKVRIALTPLVNHWWNATFAVTARGLAAPAMPWSSRNSTICSIFCANAHRNEATVKPPTQIMKSFLRPKRSANQPIGAVMIAAPTM